MTSQRRSGKTALASDNKQGIGRYIHERKKGFVFDDADKVLLCVWGLGLGAKGLMV